METLGIGILGEDLYDSSMLLMTALASENPKIVLDFGIPSGVSDCMGRVVSGK